ncbi:MAG: HAD family hydrolase [Planctomycetota bacterium]|jgi:phosphoglycolate phosphatase
MRYALAIFDFDGTLVDSFDTIAGVANRALASLGFPERRPEEVRPLVGRALATVMERLSGSAEHAAELCVRYRAFWDEADPAPLYPGMAEVLEAVASSGVSLAIATNRLRPGLEVLLEAHGLLDRFPHRVGGDCMENRKPHPDAVLHIAERVGIDPARAVVIGDTTLDVAMGHAAGADTCAVTYGASASAELAAERPTHMVDRPRALYPVLGLS